MIVKDADGNDIEVFTSDEVKTKEQAAIAEHIKENPDKSAEITKLEQERDEAKKTLEEAEKGGNKDNIKKLRDQAEKSSSEVEKVKNELLGKIEEVSKQGLTDYKNDLLDAYAKGDVELRKKMEINLGEFKNDPKTKPEMKDQIMKALRLSTDKPVADFMAGMNGFGGSRGNIPIDTGNGVKETPNGKLMRESVFGISEVDAKKYGGN